MKPFLHARISAHAYGGEWQHYQPIHDFFDTSKGALPDMRHRAMLHSDLGCALAVQVFGATRPRADGGMIDVAQIAQDHQRDDLGRTVPLAEWLSYVEKPPILKVRRIYREYDAFHEDPLAACAARWGGTPERYEHVVAWFDQARILTDGHPMADAMLLNAFGIMLSERVFGPVIEVAEKRFIPTRDVGETLALARFGRIPTLEQVLCAMRTERWMFGGDVVARRRCARSCGIPLTD